MVDWPRLPLGPIAVEPLADGQPWLALGPFADRLTIPLANVPDRFPIRRSFLAEMLALARGAWAGFSTGGWIDSAGPEYVWAGPAVVPAGSSDGGAVAQPGSCECGRHCSDPGGDGFHWP